MESKSLSFISEYGIAHERLALVLSGGPGRKETRRAARRGSYQRVREHSLCIGVGVGPAGPVLAGPLFATT